jgi:hypothetical protein
VHKSDKSQEVSAATARSKVQMQVMARGVNRLHKQIIESQSQKLPRTLMAPSCGSVQAGIASRRPVCVCVCVRVCPENMCECVCTCVCAREHV